TLEDVLASITGFVTLRLYLMVNQSKSTVGRPWKCKFLEYLFTHHFEPQLKVACESEKRFKGKLTGAVSLWSRTQLASDVQRTALGSDGLGGVLPEIRGAGEISIDGAIVNWVPFCGASGNGEKHERSN
ncbi:MAG: hypothetical protein QM501_15340, partial [Gimesia sp.]